MNKIGIASDHAGYEMKEFLVGYLDAMGYEVLDFGTHSPDSVDYADFAHPLAEAIENGELERGIALCGSGEGMTMTLNKHQGIRAGLAWEPEIASLIRRHNNANIIVFPARFITNDEAVAMLDAYFAAQFEGGRHEHRIERWRSSRRSRGCGKIRDKTCGRGLFRARRMPGRAMTDPTSPTDEENGSSRMRVHGQCGFLPVVRTALR